MSEESGNMNAANIANPEVVEDKFKKKLRPSATGNDRKLHLVADNDMIQMLTGSLPDAYSVISKDDIGSLIDQLASGDSMVWIGSPVGLPEDLWVGSFKPADADLRITSFPNSPINVDAGRFSSASASSAYIKPVHPMGFHNVNEEIRADFLPILEARDRFDEVIGYPAVMMNYYAPSLAGSRFYEAKCWFFFFDKPTLALNEEGWMSILSNIAANFESGIQVKRVETDYAMYHSGERVHVRVRLQNHKPDARSVSIRYLVKSPSDSDFRFVVMHRRCSDAFSETEAVADLLINGEEGNWTIRVEVLQDPAHADELSVLGEPVFLERRDIGIIVINGALKTPDMIEIDGPCIKLDGKCSFWAGTHYYPSSSWWEWVWRDFRPLNAAINFQGIRKAGYRIARIWIDPILDEQTLRAMDAAIYIAAQNGILLDVCIFTQWVRTIGFERPNGEHVAWDFRAPGDFNVYSISLRHIALQQEYMATLASRWKQAGNVIYNLANETYIKDPDASQMDPAISWDDIPAENSAYRDSCLFRKWARLITKAIRSAGGNQPVVPGYMFSLNAGGDNYIGNRDGDIAAWHCYYGPLTNVTLTYYDTICANKPLILEEFGINGWNTVSNYDDNVHHALASGAAAAMSYEWGVSWLAPEMCFTAIPIREVMQEAHIDPRWFEPIIECGRGWPIKGVGICPTSSGFAYGSIYHGTPFPAEAAAALGRYGKMGDNLGREFRPESAYVVIPEACNDKTDAFFEVFKSLWLEKAIFGVWHEDALDQLPPSTKVVIAPIMTESLRIKLDKSKAAGISVIEGTSGNWTDIAGIDRLEVNPSDGITMQVRRAVNGGTLYSLMSESDGMPAQMKTENGRSVAFGIRRFAVVHESADGIRLIEAAGDVIIDNQPFCSISNGRAIIASVDGCDILTAGKLRVLATESCMICFAREIASTLILVDEADNHIVPSGEGSFDGCDLRIDNEMSKYVIIVEFK